MLKQVHWDQVAQDYIQTGFECFQRRFCNLSRQPVPSPSKYFFHMFRWKKRKKKWPKFQWQSSANHETNKPEFTNTEVLHTSAACSILLQIRDVSCCLTWFECKKMSILLFSQCMSFLRKENPRESDICLYLSSERIPTKNWKPRLAMWVTFWAALLQSNSDNVIYNKIMATVQQPVKFLFNDKPENHTHRKYLSKYLQVCGRKYKSFHKKDL